MEMFHPGGLSGGRRGQLGPGVQPKHNTIAVTRGTIH